MNVEVPGIFKFGVGGLQNLETIGFHSPIVNVGFGLQNLDLIGIDGPGFKFGIGLQNLANEIDAANIAATANFKGDGKGSNHFKALNGTAGSTLNFSQLQNLANSHIGNFDGNGRVDFRGGGRGMHTIDNARSNKGSHFVFAI